METFYSQSAGFFDSVDGDRPYTADDMNNPWRRCFSDGIWNNLDGDATDFLVSPSDGLVVSVQPGNAILGQHWMSQDQVQLVEISPQQRQGMSRIDGIFLRMDARDTQDGRAAYMIYREGIPDTSDPEPPAKKESGNILELRVANIRLDYLQHEITQEDITDTRGTEDCPWVTLQVTSDSDLQAGHGIDITGSVISVVPDLYTAGDGITITAAGVISATAAGSGNDAILLGGQPGTLTGTISEIAPNAVRGNQYVLGADFPSVVTIGSSAFSHCFNLSEISFPACTTMGAAAFDECRSLASVDLPSLESVPMQAFQYCAALSEVSLSSASTIGQSAFWACRSLASMSIPNVETLEYDSLRSCSGLPRLDAPSLEVIGKNAFYECSALSEVNAPNCTMIRESAFWFAGLQHLSGLEGLEQIGYAAFQYCLSMSEAVLPAVQHFDGHCFESCYSLQRVWIEHTCSIDGGRNFGFCSQLESVYITAPEVCPMEWSNTFEGTPMASDSYIGHFGSIYVPSSLYIDYLSAPNWSEWSARIASMPSS